MDNSQNNQSNNNQQNNKPMKHSAFGTPIQKGNVTIYPALPPEMLRTTRLGKN
jgi:hypothetical protein